MVTKKERKEKFKRILNSYRPGETIRGENKEWIIGECQQTSYYKKKSSNPGVRVTVKKSKIGLRVGKYIYLDNMPVTIARLYAPKSKKKKDFDPKNTLRALRLAVADQLKGYKKGNLGEGNCCPGCGVSLSWVNTTVDHKSTPFDTILKDWLTMEELTLPKVKLKGRGNARSLKDPLQATSWIEYHRKRADYQLLCRSCNSSKGKG